VNHNESAFKKPDKAIKLRVFMEFKGKREGAILDVKSPSN